MTALLGLGRVLGEAQEHGAEGLAVDVPGVRAEDVHQDAAVHGQGRDQRLVGRAAVEGYADDAALRQQLQGHAVGVDQPPSGLGLGPGEDLLHGAALHQVAVVQNGHVGCRSPR